MAVLVFSTGYIDAPVVGAPSPPATLGRHAGFHYTPLVGNRVVFFEHVGVAGSENERAAQPAPDAYTLLFTTPTAAWLRAVGIEERSDQVFVFGSYSSTLFIDRWGRAGCKADSLEAGCSGAAIPSLSGTYFYADLCAGFVRSFTYRSAQAINRFEWSSLSPGSSITSFGEDAQGELYVMALGGGLWRIALM
jgi:hypothetical protein